MYDKRLLELLEELYRATQQGAWGRVRHLAEQAWTTVIAAELEFAASLDAQAKEWEARNAKKGASNGETIG